MKQQKEEVASHGRGCPEGEEAPQGVEIAVCSHPQVMCTLYRDPPTTK